MSRKLNNKPNEVETSLSARAAWLHYAGGWTQAEVAEKLGVSKLKAHRLITKANRDGIVKVYIDGDVAECLLHEQRLSEQYGLDYCEVVPDVDDGELPLKSLGPAGGQYLRRLIEGSSGDMTTVGLGHGRTMAACVENIPRTRSCDVQFVSLLGGFSRKFAANPHDVIYRLAERTGAHAYVLPVPFAADTIEDKEVLMGQRGLQEVFSMARDTPLKIAGIGSAQLNSSLYQTDLIEESDIAEITAAGGVGELVGNFFAADGSFVTTQLSQKTMGLSVADLEQSQVVAIAGGDSKVAAIKAILNSGLLNGLITDELTARKLIQTNQEL